jgi:hypothetical protein
MTDEAVEGRDAFLQKRDPRWDDNPNNYRATTTELLPRRVPERPPAAGREFAAERGRRGTSIVASTALTGFIGHRRANPRLDPVGQASGVGSG